MRLTSRSKGSLALLLVSAGLLLYPIVRPGRARLSEEQLKKMNAVTALLDEAGKKKENVVRELQAFIEAAREGRLTPEQRGRAIMSVLEFREAIGYSLAVLSELKDDSLRFSELCPADYRRANEWAAAVKAKSLALGTLTPEIEVFLDSLPPVHPKNPLSHPL